MQATATIITLQNGPTGWTATFEGSAMMPNGIALPLPFTSAAPHRMVLVDIARRFPLATISTQAGSR